MSQMLRSQGETLDEATGLVQSHIKKNEPVWKLDYFGERPITSFKPRSTEEWLDDIQNPNLPTYKRQQQIYNAVRPRNISIDPSDVMLLNSRPARLIGLVVQGMANGASDLVRNVTGNYLDYDIKPIQANNPFEKGLENGGKALYGILKNKGASKIGENNDIMDKVQKKGN